MRKNCMIPALLLSLLLTACGMGGTEADSGRNSFWDELGMDAAEPVLTVDGREVPAWKYLWWLTENCEAMEEACAAAGVTADWDAALETGTLADYVERQTLADTVLYATVENWAETWGVTLSEEPSESRMGEQNSRWQESWQRQEMDAVGLRYQALCALAAEADSPMLSDEALSAFGDAEGYLTVDQIVFAAGEDTEEARRQAEEAFGRLNHAADKGAMFEALSAGDGSSETVLLREETAEPGLWAAASALETAQHSGILETEQGGYCILRRLENSRGDLAALWVEAELQRAAAEAVVEAYPAMETITVPALLGGLSACETE